MTLYVFTKNCNIIYTKIDYVVFLFLAYNILFLSKSFVHFGIIEGLYVVKNYIISLLLYFAVILFFDEKKSKNIITLIMFVCTFVSIIYITEFVNNFILHNDYFTYTKLMDQYSIEARNVIGGVSKSWVKGDLYTMVRMAGPLGHNNATAFIIAIGSLISISMIVFRHPQRGKYIAFIICIIGLILTGARTSLLASIAGIAALSIAGLKYNYIRIRHFAYMSLTVFLVIAALISCKVIDFSAYKQIFSTEPIVETVTILASVDEFQEFYLKVKNPIAFIIGYGFPPTKTGMRDSYSSVMSEDVFFVELLSQYGVVFSLIFSLMFLYSLRHSYVNCKKNSFIYFNNNLFVIWAVISMIIASFVSIAHTNAVIRPQINPILVISVAAFSVIIREGRKLAR